MPDRGELAAYCRSSLYGNLAAYLRCRYTALIVRGPLVQMTLPVNCPNGGAVSQAQRQPFTRNAALLGCRLTAVGKMDLACAQVAGGTASCCQYHFESGIGSSPHVTDFASLGVGLGVGDAGTGEDVRKGVSEADGVGDDQGSWVVRGGAVGERPHPASSSAVMSGRPTRTHLIGNLPQQGASLARLTLPQ